MFLCLFFFSIRKDPSNHLNHANQASSNQFYQINGTNGTDATSLLINSTASTPTHTNSTSNGPTSNANTNPNSMSNASNSNSNNSSNNNNNNNIILYSLNNLNDLRQSSDHHLSNNSSASNSSTSLNPRRLTQDWQGSYPVPSPYSNASLGGQSQSGVEPWLQEEYPEIDINTPMPDQWCTINYFEGDLQVGDIFKGKNFVLCCLFEIKFAHKLVIAYKRT